MQMKTNAFYALASPQQSPVASPVLRPQQITFGAHAVPASPILAPQSPSRGPVISMRTVMATASSQSPVNSIGSQTFEVQPAPIAGSATSSIGSQRLSVSGAPVERVTYSLGSQTFTSASLQSGDAKKLTLTPKRASVEAAFNIDDVPPMPMLPPSSQPVIQTHLNTGLPVDIARAQTDPIPGTSMPPSSPTWTAVSKPKKKPGKGERNAETGTTLIPPPFELERAHTTPCDGYSRDFDDDEEGLGVNELVYQQMACSSNRGFRRQDKQTRSVKGQRAIGFTIAEKKERSLKQQVANLAQGRS